MGSESTGLHRREAPEKVSVAVLTVSDSKFSYHWMGREGVETEDVSGREIRSMVEEAGHEVVFYCIVPDHEGMIAETVDHLVSSYAPDAIIATGGTGIGPRDVTIEALESVFEKRLDGFGELFRLESEREVGGAAMLSRATAGVYRGVVVFCLPGSPSACKTGVRLILQEIGHVVKHAKKG